MTTAAAGAAAGLCDEMEAAEQAGYYPRVTVCRPWSEHRREVTGELACTRVLRPWLEWEFARLLQAGADITAGRGRQAGGPLDNSELDETRVNRQEMRLLMFGPGRIELSADRLHHYTGTDASRFQSHVILTNYAWHTDAFQEIYPGCSGPDHGRRPMPAWHCEQPGNSGVSIVNIGTGPSNAKTFLDCLAVLHPRLIIMAGHCGGLKNQQEIGDYVVARSFVRDDHVLDHVLDPRVPVLPDSELNSLLFDEIASRSISISWDEWQEGRKRCRRGCVYTTGNRNWDFQYELVKNLLADARAYAADMESGTICAQCHRYRISFGALLLVSDRPLHRQHKQDGPAQRLFRTTHREHVEIAAGAIDRFRKLHPDGPWSAPGNGL